MNRLFRSLFLSLVLVSGVAIAAEPTEPVERDQTATPSEPEKETEHKIEIRVSDDPGNVVVNVWGEARLAAKDVADGVIAVFGDAHVEGEVTDAVVTIFGNAYVTGPVHGGVVSLFGNTYIDGPVQEAAVAVFGDLELGPNARVDGDIAVVAGKLTRDPAAEVHGKSEIVAGGFPALESVRLWIEKCLFYGRLLAFDKSARFLDGLLQQHDQIRTQALEQRSLRQGQAIAERWGIGLGLLGGVRVIGVARVGLGRSKQAVHEREDGGRVELQRHPDLLGRAQLHQEGGTIGQSGQLGVTRAARDVRHRTGALPSQKWQDSPQLLGKCRDHAGQDGARRFRLTLIHRGELHGDDVGL